MGRSPCCDKTKVRRGTWSPEEDATLKNYIHNHGIGGNWISLPLRAGLQRCGKSCRLRWLNYLRPDIKHGGFTSDEEYIICHLYNKIGSRWSVIASHLPGRTDNDVKNYWNTKLKKKLISPTKSDMETTAAAASKAAAATSGAATTSQDVPTNVVALQDHCFPVPFQLDAQSVSNEPTHYDSFPTFLLEGSSGNNMNFPFSPFHQDSSHLSPFNLGVDGIENGVKMDECGIWSQEEEAIAIGGDRNADLFGVFFHVDSKSKGVGQSH